MEADSAMPEQSQRHSSGRRLHGALEHYLGRAILSGSLPPGQLLSPEVDSARELAVSRTSYREAVRALVDKGLVERRPQSGTRVLERERWNLLDPDILDWAFTVPVDVNYVRSLMELREIVAPVAARKAAASRTDAQLKLMREQACDMRGQGYWTGPGALAEQSFTKVMLQASGNEMLSRLGSSLKAAIGWTRKLKDRLPTVPPDLTRHYLGICDVIRDGDCDGAETRMRALLEAATLGLDNVLASMVPTGNDQKA